MPDTVTPKAEDTTQNIIWNQTLYKMTVASVEFNH